MKCSKRKMTRKRKEKGETRNGKEAPRRGRLSLEIDYRSRDRATVPDETIGHVAHVSPLHSFGPLRIVSDRRSNNRLRPDRFSIPKKETRWIVIDRFMDAPTSLTIDSIETYIPRCVQYKRLYRLSRPFQRRFDLKELFLFGFSSCTLCTDNKKTLIVRMVLLLYR